jgi:hypothetical protein
MQNTISTDNSLAAVYEPFLNKLIVTGLIDGRTFAAKLVRIGKAHLVFQNRRGVAWCYRPEVIEWIALQKHQEGE